MKSNTYYPPGTVCASDLSYQRNLSASSNFQQFFVGKSLVIRCKIWCAYNFCLYSTYLSTIAGFAWTRCRTTLFRPNSLTVTMRVREQWWEESTPSSPRSPGTLLSLSILRGRCTSKAGEVVYSLAYSRIRRISPHTICNDLTQNDVSKKLSFGWRSSTLDTIFLYAAKFNLANWWTIQKGKICCNLLSKKVSANHILGQICYKVTLVDQFEPQFLYIDHGETVAAVSPTGIPAPRWCGTSRQRTRRSGSAGWDHSPCPKVINWLLQIWILHC